MIELNIRLKHMHVVYENVIGTSSQYKIGSRLKIHESLPSVCTTPTGCTYSLRPRRTHETQRCACVFLI